MQAEAIYLIRRGVLLPIRYFVKSPRATPKDLPDGRVDFFELDLIHNVRMGQVLAEAYDEPEWFDPRAFPAGENTYVPEENPRVLCAAVDGHAFWRDGKIHVSPEFVVQGDVDYSTGNLRFAGRLILRGTVRSGFIIEAKEAVVEGDLEGTALIRGDLEVKGGIVSGKHKVIVGGNLKANYVLNSVVEVRGQMEVIRFIRDSRVFSGSSVKVLGEPGAVLGGEVRAKDSVSARIFGSPMSSGTKVWVGLDPFLGRFLEEKRSELESRKEELDEAIKDPDLGIEERLEFLRELEELKFYLELLEEALLGEGGSIEVLGRAFQGVTFRIGRECLKVAEDLLGPLRLRLREGKIALERWT